MEKTEITAVLEEIAVMLELKGENPFKVRAYQNGARALETCEAPLDELIRTGQLAEVKGIGSALAEKIETLHTTGSLPYYDELKASTPPGLLECLQIPGLGAKKLKALYSELGVDSITTLQKACLDGKVAKLKGFGEKTQANILTGIQNREAYAKRHLWIDAWRTAAPILEGLRAIPEVKQAEIAGSLRRGRETVGDLDFIVASTQPAPIMQWFTASVPGTKEVTAHGETKSSIRLESGIQADLRVVPPHQFAFALHHFTGSKEHNVHMRQRALERGLSMSEWGLFDKDGTTNTEPSQRVSTITANSETDLFRALGLDFIPPELREDQGEIEAAASGNLPTLIEESDIRGAFHNHTTASDGRNSLEAMRDAAARLGWEYLGIADHSKASFQANGLSEERLLQQVALIQKLNQGAADSGVPWLFAGVECDIHADGTLDYDDDILKQLDYVVVSVHSSFQLPADEMTRRIIRALEHPLATMLGHLTGRLLLQREGYAVDVNKIIDAAAANGKVIEINAHPRRLDMDWRHWRRAAEKGVLAAINPDAHSDTGLAYFSEGVRIARKGWLTRENVLNTRPLAEIQEWLARRK